MEKQFITKKCKPASSQSIITGTGTSVLQGRRM